jgi:hypothetical protein
MRKSQNDQHIVVKQARFETATIDLVGTAPYVQHAFAGKARLILHDRQAQGSRAKKGAKRDPKDFEQQYHDALYVSTDGRYGIPAAAFRIAMIDACRLAGYQMTRGKLALSIQADGYTEDMTALVFFTAGEPKYFETPVRNETGVVDLRARPKWAPGWRVALTVRWDADEFSAEDVVNLLHRAGQQVGVGEGRPFSKNSAGQGWGTFEVAHG